MPSRQAPPRPLSTEEALGRFIPPRVEILLHARATIAVHPMRPRFFPQEISYGVTISLAQLEARK